jgi:hypothetical protein
MFHTILASTSILQIYDYVCRIYEFRLSISLIKIIHMLQFREVKNTTFLKQVQERNQLFRVHWSGLISVVRRWNMIVT